MREPIADPLLVALRSYAAAVADFDASQILIARRLSDTLACGATSADIGHARDVGVRLRNMRVSHALRREVGLRLLAAAIAEGMTLGTIRQLTDWNAADEVPPGLLDAARERGFAEFNRRCTASA